MKCYNQECGCYDSDKPNGCFFEKDLNACPDFKPAFVMSGCHSWEPPPPPTEIISKTNTKETKTMNTEFFQTPYARETIAIIKDPDGSISIGFARAGRTDIENRRVTPKDGMDIAEGRAIKARTTKTALCERNYLRGIHALPVEMINPVQQTLTGDGILPMTERVSDMYKLHCKPQ